MPVADGWAATKGMRELDAARARSGSEQQLQVPVVVCTASCLDDLVEGGETVAQRALTLGANGAVVSSQDRAPDPFASTTATAPEVQSPDRCTTVTVSC